MQSPTAIQSGVGSVSIGVVDKTPAYKETSRYWKCIVPGLHGSLEEVEDALRFAAAATDGCGSRIAMRIAVKNDLELMEAVRSLTVPWRDSKIHCEAAILVGRGELGVIYYFSANESGRQRSEEIGQQEKEIWDDVSLKARKQSSPEKREQVEILSRDHPSSADIRAIIGVYHACFTDYLIKFDEVSVRAMIHDNTVAVVRNEIGKIVAVSQAEKLEVEFGGETWKLVELSDTACHPDYRGHDFTQLCNDKLIELFRGERSIIYTENRADWGAVNRSSVNSGLMFAGVLEQHCLMHGKASDIPECVSLPWADLIVCYLPQ